MEFEYDVAKSQANRDKHGLDFEAAQRLWEDKQRVEFAARSDDELRYLVIGQLDGRLWSAVITYREGRVRLISVRRAREQEKRLYESSRI